MSPTNPPPDMTGAGWVNATPLASKGQDIWIEGSEVDEILEEEIGAIPSLSSKFM